MGFKQGLMGALLSLCVGVSVAHAQNPTGHSSTLIGRAFGPGQARAGVFPLLNPAIPPAAPAGVTSVELRLDSTTGIFFTNIVGDGTSAASFTIPFGTVDAFGVSAPAPGAFITTTATVDGSSFTGAVYWTPYSMNIRVNNNGTGTVTVLQTPAPTAPFGTTANRIRVVDCTTNANCTSFRTIPSSPPELSLVSGVVDNTTNFRAIGISVPADAPAGTGSATVRWTLVGM